MNWLRNRFSQPLETATPRERELARLAEAGTDVVLFIPGCALGCICETARLLEGGRIPIKLAEPTPLDECSNPDGCRCRYEALPDRTAANAAEPQVPQRSVR